MFAMNYNEKRNVGEFVYQTIRQQIIDWELKPGQQISEKLISDELQVSRTPVREAFIKLTGENLIEAKPYVGTFVTYIDIDQVCEARFIRESLERSVIELACETDMSYAITLARENLKKQKEFLKKGDMVSFIECDDEFHKGCFLGCGKKMSWDVVCAVNSQYNRLRLLCLRAENDNTRLIKEHDEIINAIEKQDRKTAVSVMAVHLQRILEEINHIKKMYPDYFK